MMPSAYRLSLIAYSLWVFASGATALAATDPAQLAAARALFAASDKAQEAEVAYEKIAAADPACAEAQNYLAQLALRRDDADQARAHAEKAAALAPDNADIQNTLGDAYGRSAQKAGIFSQLGLAKKSLAAYQRAVALEPNNVDYHQDLLEYYREAPGIAGGGMDKALVEAAAIKKLDAQRGHLAFGTLYTADKKFDQALAEFDAALKTAPDDYDALYQVGKLGAQSGQHLDRGLAALQRCFELTPPATPDTPSHAAVQWRMGNIFEKKNDLVHARTAYEAALQIDPQLTQAAEALKRLK